MDLKVIEKSRKLLIQVIGQENFNKFIEDGKIEVVHGEGKDKIVYELDQDGRVFNRTKEQSYCIEPIASNNLPLHDQLAIKYGYLKNNIKRVEEVANKRNTGPRETGGLFNNIIARSAGTSDTELLSRQRRFGHMEDPHRPSYNQYVEYMEGMGWSRNQLTLDERNTRIVAIENVNRNNNNDHIIDITCPAGQKISIMGIQQLPPECDLRTAHSFRARIADERDSEVSYDTRIRITKEKTTESIIQLARLFYADINLTTTRSTLDAQNLTLYKTDDQWYRFRQGVELNGQDHLRVYVNDCETDICARNLRMALDLDLWVM